MPRTLLTDRLLEKLCLDMPMHTQARAIPKNASRKLRSTLSHMPKTQVTLMSQAAALANTIAPGNSAFLEAMMLVDPMTTSMFVYNLTNALIDSELFKDITLVDDLQLQNTSTMQYKPQVQIPRWGEMLSQMIRKAGEDTKEDFMAYHGHEGESLADQYVAHKYNNHVFSHDIPGSHDYITPPAPPNTPMPMRTQPRLTTSLTTLKEARAGHRKEPELREHMPRDMAYYYDHAKANLKNTPEGRGDIFNGKQVTPDKGKEIKYTPRTNVLSKSKQNLEAIAAFENKKFDLGDINTLVESLLLSVEGDLDNYIAVQDPTGLTPTHLIPSHNAQPDNPLPSVVEALADTGATAAQNPVVAL